MSGDMSFGGIKLGTTGPLISLDLSKYKSTKQEPAGGKAVAAREGKVPNQNNLISSANLRPGIDIKGNMANPVDETKVDTTDVKYTSGSEMGKTHCKYWDLVGSFFQMFPGMFSKISTGYFGTDGKLRGIREAVFNSLVLGKDGARTNGEDMANHIKEEDTSLVYVDLNTLYDQLCGMGLRFSRVNFIKMIGEGESRIKLDDFNSKVEYLSNYFNGTGHSPAEYAYLGLISDKLTGKEHFRINYALYNEGDGGACAKLHLESDAERSEYLAEMEEADPARFAMAKSLMRADREFAEANGIVFNTNDEDERTLYWLTVLYQEAVINDFAVHVNIPTAKFYTADFAPGGKHYESFNTVLKQYMESGGKFLPIDTVNDWFKIGDSQKAPNKIAKKNSMFAEKKDDTNKIEQDKEKTGEKKKAEEEKVKEEEKAEDKAKEQNAQTNPKIQST